MSDLVSLGPYRIAKVRRRVIISCSDEEWPGDPSGLNALGVVPPRCLVP